MKRNYHWEKIPAKIVSLERSSTSGTLRIEAVLESLGSDEVKQFKVIWVNAPSVEASEKTSANFLPNRFLWAYKYAKEGQKVELHHCLEDDSKYFYFV